MLLALAVVDLPLEAEEPTINREKGGSGNAVTLTSTDTPCMIFVEELVESSLVSSTLSVHSNYFDPKDDSEIVYGEKVDKFVVGTFETHRCYGCKSVITNVSSVKQEIEVLLQIPSGSVPVNGSYRTRSVRLELSPFMTERLTFYFYFPSPSPEYDDFRCFPVHINKNGKTVAYSLDERLSKMKVVSGGDESLLSRKAADLKADWNYLCGPNGTAQDIIGFCESNPRVYEVEWSKLSSRLAAEPKFFDALTAVLKERGIYEESVWKYALVSDKGGAELSEFLAMNEKFIKYILPYFSSDAFNFDPFERFHWSLTEFAPLISARTHCDGTIQPLSHKFLDQYAIILLILSFRSASVGGISSADKLVLVQYLLYQERVFEAKRLFESIPESEGKAISALFYEYLQCFLLIFDGVDGGPLTAVQTKCMSWRAKPLPLEVKALWQDLEDIAKEVAAPDSVAAVFDDDYIEAEHKEKTQFLDFSLISKKDLRSLDLSFRNLSACTLNFYAVDLELLFSESPFKADNEALANLVATVYPNESMKVSLPKESTAPPDRKFKPTDGNVHHYVDLPERYRGTNCIIEVVADRDDDDGVIRSVHPLNDHSMAVQFDRGNAMGQCRVVYNNKKDKERFKRPIAGSYCKVYAKDEVTGKAVFYKDGYTDIRGRFSWRNLSTDQLARSSELSMFVQSPENGATVIPIKIASDDDE